MPTKSSGGKAHKPATKKQLAAAKKKAQVTIDDIHVVYRSSKRVTEKQLDAFERTFGADLPHGYREFLTRYGHGWLNDWLQFYLPGNKLLTGQRESLVQQFLSYQEQFDSFDSGLTEDDMRSSVQIGIVQDVERMFACPRFPGSVFSWDGLEIVEHRSGIEILDPFAALRMELFTYFMPLQPVPEHRSLACKSKRLEVPAVVEALQNKCRGNVQVIDVDEGPGEWARTPAFWLFPEKLGVKLHVYGVESPKDRRVYLTFGTSPKLLPKVEALIENTSSELGVQFKPANWY